MEENKVIWPGWEVVRKIGSGSFGAVYEIQRTIRGRTEHAAVKQLTIPQSKSEIAELRADGYDDESITQYFADSLDKIEGEYAMMADMKGHSNVVYCDDLRSVPHEDGFGWDIYIKMELLSPMKSALSDGAVQDQAVRLGIDICGALELCEKMQIVHRDIKPENIFVSRDGTFKLGDFGIARTMEGTTGGTKTGTYDYMAPEVYNNRPYHTQADIYSLGLVLYWLLNERTVPFLPIGARPTPSTKSAARERRFSGEALPEPANGSDALKAIVLKACAFDPKDRYQTAAEMREDLKKLDTGAVLVPPVIPAASVEPVPGGEGTVNIFSGKQAQPAPSGEGTVNIFSGNADEEKTEYIKEEKTEYIREEKTEYIPRSASVPEEKKKKKNWLFPVIAVVLVIAILLVMLRSCGGEPAGPGETTGSTPGTTQTESTTAPTTGETTVPPTTEVTVLPTTESTVPPTTEVTVPPATAPEQTVPPAVEPTTGATSNNDLEGTYNICVWVSPTIKELTEKQISNFNKNNTYGIKFHATVEPVDESVAASYMTADADAGADIFCFTQDQTARLIRAGVLAPLSKDTAQLVKNSYDKASVGAVTSGDNLYGYPLTSDNGYFMYYDKSVIPETAIGNMTDLIAAAKAAGRNISFELENSWYIVSYFFGAGCVSEWKTDDEGKFIDVNDNFNSETGLIAAKGLQELLTSGIYVNSSQIADFDAAVKSAVVVSGVWDYEKAKSILGDNLGVAELPSFTVDGKDYHLGSYNGCKLMGVKPQSDAKRAAALHQLAQYLTGEKAQLERFNTVGWGPSNLKAQASDAVKATPHLTALIAQNAYSRPQGQIHGSWWDIARNLAVDIKNGVDLAQALQKYADAIYNLFNLSDETKRSWTVIGAVGDSDWTKDLPMTEQADGTWKTNVAYTMEAGDEFKVRKGKSWDINYGDGDRNFVVAVRGTYYIVFNPATCVISLVAK